MPLQDQNIVAEALDPVINDGKLLDAKLRKVSKDLFKDTIANELDYVDFLNFSYKFFSLRLPQEINEFFVYKDSAPFLLISEHPVLKRAEHVIQEISKSAINSYEQTKKYYSKWLNNNSEKEQQYFALTTLNLLEKDRSKINFLKYLLHGVILSYDKRLYSPEKAAKLIQESISILENLDIKPELKNELTYYLYLYSGFFHLRRADFENANYWFIEAQRFKYQGVSAVFYNSLMELRLNHPDMAIQQLEEVIQFDRKRLRFAVMNNNFRLFAFFVKNAVSHNIFRESGFGDMVDEVVILLKSIRNYDKKFVYDISNKLSQLEQLKFKEFYSDKNTQDLNFIKNFLLKTEGEENLLVNYSFDFIQEKYSKVLEEIASGIRGKYQSIVDKELSVYDMQLKQIEETIEAQKHELSMVDSKVEAMLETSLQKVDKVYKSKIENIEYNIDHLDAVKEYDPAKSFSSALAYSALISVTVFVIGGFSTGFINNAELNGSVAIMDKILISGLKWGSVTFALGLVTSIFITLSAIWDRVNYRQRMLKEITFLKNFKANEIEAVKREYEKKRISMENSINKHICSLEKELNFMKKDRGNRKIKLEEGILGNLDEYDKKLKKLI